MGKKIKKPQPLYLAVQDEDTFKLVTAEIQENDDDKSVWIKRTPLTLIETHDQLRDVYLAASQEEYDFYLSYLVLSEAELKQRRTVLRISDRHTRNIKCKTKTTEQYLIQSIKNAIIAKQYPYTEFPNMTKTEINELKRKIPKDEFKGLFEDAFLDIKKKLGVPASNDSEFSYRISQEVLAQTTTPECLEYLEKMQAQQAQEYLDINEFQKICAELEQRFPEETEEIITTFTNTKSRDHIAVFSLTTEYGQTFVSIANAENQHIKMESWKFIRLVEENGTTVTLHSFSKDRRNLPAEPFEFNHNKEGRVVGRFNVTGSNIQINCADEDNPQNKVHDNATFNVDTSYILCLYTILKRLRQDKEKFDRLLEKAKTKPPLYDPFNS